jgi:hypothetical protein
MQSFLKNNFHGFLLDIQFPERLVIHFTLYFAVILNFLTQLIGRFFCKKFIFCFQGIHFMQHVFPDEMVAFEMLIRSMSV